MIPISKPIIAKNASKYLLECLKTGWVSSKGPFVEKFENAFAKFVGTKYAVACSSGTHALHLALASLNIGPGDEVIVPALTMIAAVLPIIYLGATPVLVDSEEGTGNLDVSKIEEKITKKTKAIIVVHLNGHPADMAPLLTLARRYKLFVIEDAAESHGAEYRMPNGKWKMAGNIGDLGCFSFYGNKIITTGEGGMVTTNDKTLAERIKSLRNLARSKQKHFYHQEIAFAYRMSSLQAALGLAQLEQVDKIIKIKKHLASSYINQLKSLTNIILPIQKPFTKRVYWNFDILLKDSSQRDKLAKFLENHQVETRIFVIPLHLQPAFLRLGLFKGQRYLVTEKFGKVGLSLPLGPSIKDSEVNHICKLIVKFFNT